VVDAPAVGAAAAAGTIADNYAACLDWRAQVIGWQQWYSTVTGRRRDDQPCLLPAARAPVRPIARALFFRR
jgi:hypothetical protein